MESRLYHKDVYLPKKIKNLGNCHASWEVITRHAMDKIEFIQSKFGINPENKIEFTGKNIVEFESGETPKFVVRINHNSKLDLIYCFKISNNKTVLVTVWVNYSNDNHSTLDESKYYVPDNR